MNVTSLNLGISFRNFILKLFPQKHVVSYRSPGLSWSGREPFVPEVFIRGC